MTTNEAIECRLCGSFDCDEPIQIKEMMFGTREVFDYVRRKACDTLQILEIPPDLGRHYPSDYYSFTPPQSSLRQRIRRLFKPERLPDWLNGIGKEATVLDIGSGGGLLLHQMYDWGFRSLIGYDPFLSECQDLRSGIRLTNIIPQGQFDLVMMHHALEHVPDPRESLRLARDYTRDGGQIVIRIPVRQGYAWRTYGPHWAHLDPPRHLTLWTVQGFTQFAERCGLKTKSFGFDGTLFSLIYSERFARDIAMKGPRSEAPALSNAERDAYNSQAAQLNHLGEGDCAWFVLESQ